MDEKDTWGQFLQFLPLSSGVAVTERKGECHKNPIPYWPETLV